MAKVAAWAPGRELRYFRNVREALGSGLPLILAVEEGVHPIRGAFGALLGAAERGLLAYSSYWTYSGEVKALPPLPDITGRFPYGPLRAYLRKRLLELEVEPSPAWEYDAQLRGFERGLLAEPVPEPLYFWSPGLRPRPDLRQHLEEISAEPPLWDPFASLRADPEAERIFKAFLKRQCAFLGLRRSESFPAGKGDYPVFATIAIPVRNRAELIPDALKSALSQTFKDYEVLVVDNASTDGTPEVVRKFNGVRLIQNPPGDVSDALNAALRHARGKYFIQLDSDDALAPEAVEECVRYMEAHPEVALAISYYEVCDESLRPTGFVVKHLEFDPDNLLRTEGAGALRCWRTEALRRLGGFSNLYAGYGEDYDAVLRTSERWLVGRIHRVLYFYRRHPGNQDARRPLLERLKKKTAARLSALHRRKLLNFSLRAPISPPGA